MCGISGYVGPKSASAVIEEGLERLQYRGYDSAGIALQLDGDLRVFRVQGPVENLAKETSRSPVSHLGIGHTRWATHGGPTSRNAHPLVSCDGTIAVVHNGVIENHGELRARLVAQGHTFVSDTDSEVIPHLLEELVRHGASLQEAFCTLPSRLMGSFAIACMQRDFPGILLTRRGSPLVVGVGQGEYFPASDIPSFLSYTPRVIYLKEDECVLVDVDGARRLQLGPLGEGITEDTTLDSTTVNLRLDSFSKGNFDHFMIKEILEQAGVLASTLDDQRDLLLSLASEMQLATRIVVLGMGTSFHSAEYGELLARDLGMWNVHASASSEVEQFDSVLGPTSLIIALSQSGETADTLRAIEHARKRGTRIWGITNSAASSLARRCDRVLEMRCGPELAVAATKSYVAQLSLIIQALFESVQRRDEGTRRVRDAYAALYDLTSNSVRLHIRALAAEFVDSSDLFILGRRFERVTAQEGALKLKEVAGMRAEALLSSELKHGPLALIHEGSKVLLLYRSSDVAHAETVASEIASRGARVYTIGPEPLSVTAWHIRTPDVGIAMPLIQVVPIQLLSYELARLRNLNPDRPPNLAKSVTVL